MIKKKNTFHTLLNKL